MVQPSMERIGAGDRLRDAGNLEEALLLYRALLDDPVMAATAHFKIGTVQARQGRPEEAAASYRHALALRPGYPEATNNLALMHMERAETEPAEALYRDLLAELPEYYEAHINLGNLLLDDGCLAEAQYHFRRAVTLRPESGLARDRLGSTLRNRGRLGEAMAELEQALVLAPDLFTAWNNLGTCHFALGHHALADAAFEKSLALQPEQSQAWHNRLMLANFRSLRREDVFARHRAWGEHVRLVSPDRAAGFPNCALFREGPLRIGFVSGDLRRHSVAYFLLGSIAAVDRRIFELHAYPTRATEDEMTARLRPLFSGWHRLAGLSDEEAADMIRSHGIDLLIDLSGHTNHNRLRMFVQRPAPIQITWLGYPNTTGLDAIDYRLTDAVADPPGESEAFHCEELVRLPRPFLCYAPPPEAPQVVPPPVQQNGFITFGSFNARVKLGEDCIMLWSRVLAAVPGSRLLLKSIHGADEQASREELVDCFSRQGIDPVRIEVLGPIDDVAGHLSAYGRVDVALDSLPYQGTTTTCEALWMGVPVISRLGDRHAGRVAATLLGSLGLVELVAADDDSFVALAMTLAGDRPRLEALRFGLRERMRASSLMDSVAMGEALGNLWRRMWRRYREGLPQLPSADEPAAETGDPACSPSEDPDLTALMGLVNLGAHADVERVARGILARRPGQALAMKALVFALIGQARFEEALPAARACVSLPPGDAENLNNLGIVESELMLWPEAVPHFQQAIALSPDDPELHKNLAAAHYRMQQWGEAIPILLRAIELHPGDYVDAVKLLAASLLNGRRHDEALTCFEELLKAEPDNLQALYFCIHARLNACCWDGLADMTGRLWEGFDRRPGLLDSPLMAVSIPGIDTRRQQAVAEHFSRFWLPSVMAGAPVALRRPAGTRLRVGYLSGDFRDHPVGYVLPRVIESHDRRRVETWGLSIGPDDGSETRRRLERAFEHFVDLEKLSVPATTEAIRALDLDILVDLSGWTSPNRAEALALRCAPVQAGWLGYAGSSGSRAMWDHLIADCTVVPDAEVGSYAERVARLPHAYLPVTPAVPGHLPPRAEEGLPAHGFVFCSFNSYYKLNPGVFDAWCAILRAVPDSVLWLPRASASIADRLRGEAEARGVSASRLVFARFCDRHEDHLARLPLADLALDPFPYNSHSTGCEILQAGVPMVALLGENFAARAGASLLHAAGMGELVVEDVDGYVVLATALALDPPRLAALRRRVEAAGRASSLVNMDDFARDLERLLFAMAEDALPPS